MRYPLPYKYIAVEGNIGAGKTSLASILSSAYHAVPAMESFAENTFLPQFYNDPSRYAFPLEMSFLAERYRQLSYAITEASDEGRPLISDYIFEKSLLFASVNLQGEEQNLFREFFKLLAVNLKKPDLLIYLDKSTDKLLENINERGREFEKSISPEYLDRISEGYLSYLKTLEQERVIIIETNESDFVSNPVHLRYFLDLVRKEHPRGIQILNPGHG